MIGLTILGSTGSVGLSTLDVVRRNRGRFTVEALTAASNDVLLAQQCREFQPAVAVLADYDAAARLARTLRADGVRNTEVLAGAAALETAARLGSSDYVMAAIVGAAGLLPTLAAARAGKRVLLANKEAAVMSGALLMRAIRDNAATLIPIDSEHNAVYQCLGPAATGPLEGVASIVLTASGGPFLDADPAALSGVTPEQACAHPNWEMGRKISVDSATMMNKGLEVIEACCLFGIDVDRVDVVVHPQSIVHSLVRYCDGSVLAQLGNPDMRTPIAHALGWPERIDSGVPALDLVAVGQLDFRAPDLRRFPCLGLAMGAARHGGAAPVMLNAANEVAVAAFLERRVPFTAIGGIIDAVLAKCTDGCPSGLDEILAIDARARQLATDILERFEL
jgi:1-deoxy-D-xylulose-5-phosphate reductoisomerase